MRRPLCPAFLGLLAIVSLILTFFPDTGEDPYLAWDGARIMLEGRVTSRDDSVVYVLPDASHTKTVQVSFGEGQSLPSVGTRIRVAGRVRCFSRATNPGEFDAYAYYRMRGIAFRMTECSLLSCEGHPDLLRESLQRIRQVFSGVLSRIMNEKDAGMMKAVLLGDKSAMDADLKQLYRVSGVLHLACISGLHCTALGAGLYGLLKRLRMKRWLAVLCSISLMAAYGLMCGMPTSAARAIFMFSLMIAAPLLGRTYDMLSACALIGILMLIEEPLYAGDCGFLLSFGSIMALGLVLPALKAPAQDVGKRSSRTGKREVVATDIRECLSLPMLRGASGRRRLIFAAWAAIRKTVVTGFYASFSVSVVTLPVYMCYYHTFPVYAVFLNIVMIPLMAIVMPAGVLSIAAGLLHPAAGRIFGTINHLILHLYESLCLCQRTLPGHTWYAGAAAPWQVALYYALLAAFVWLSDEKRRARNTTRAPVMQIRLRRPTGRTPEQIAVADRQDNGSGKKGMTK